MDRCNEHIRAYLLQRDDRDRIEAAKADRTGQAKFFMLLTFILGAVFLGVKAYEYQSKFRHGIYPQKTHSLIYEKPDVNSRPQFATS